MLDLDRYYTPDDVADQLLEQVAPSNPRCCADSSCGAGSLLRAARRVFAGVACVGVDKDRAAILSLRRRHPDWRLSVADVLNPTTYGRARVLASQPACDILTLNPPFSMTGCKNVAVGFNGKQFHTSVAMAYVLRSLELFRPLDGAITIVPESLLFSDVDESARIELSRFFTVRPGRGLRNTTFRGARANAVVVRIAPRPEVATRAPEARIVFLDGIEVVRGGLPLFEARFQRSGIPLVHSTDIGNVVKFRSMAGCDSVGAIQRGVVSGAVILIPRVGVPAHDSLAAVYLRSRVQLSDCVIALKLRSMRAAGQLSVALRTQWPQFAALYRGTGARYITMRRLIRWLSVQQPVV